MMRALALTGCGVLALVASGCESTEEQSAQLGHEGSKLAASGGTVGAGATNNTVRVSHVTLLSSGGRTAVALQLTSNAGQPELNVPIRVNLLGSSGKVLYSNNVSGLDSTLQQMPLLRPHQSGWWVDDQVLVAQAGGRVQVHVSGGPTRARTTLPDVAASGVHVGTQAGISVVSGTLVNHSKTTVSKVPVFAVSLNGASITAAGRALISTLPPGSTSFQIFLVGHPTGSPIQITVAPTVPKEHN
jgi:hypothetical protein